MAEAFNRIHAAVCVKVYGREDETSPAGRRKYQWHKYDFMLEMKEGEQVLRYANRREYGIFRTIASKYWRECGARFKFSYKNGSMTITRTI